MTEEDTPFFKRSAFWRFLIIWGLFAVFLWQFRKDILPTLRAWLNLVLIVYDYTVLTLFGIQQQNFVPPTFQPMDFYFLFKMPTMILVFCVVYLISLFVVAQFILPVHALGDRVMAWRRLRSYLWGGHGPAVFVHEGKLVERTRDDERVSPGVALVDLRSALVLEQTFVWSYETESDDESVAVRPKAPRFASRRPREEDWSPVARICGPGIHFTNWGEKIRNVIDLRPQLRSEGGVKALTKDGIEVETRVFVGFSLSDAPDVITVGYVGGPLVNNLRGLHVEEKSLGQVVIKETYPLDAQDAWEIHQLVETGWRPPEPPMPIRGNGHASHQGPFAFDKRRVFAAAYGQAHAQPGGSYEKTQWHELPVPVAVEIFRNHLEQYPYDFLYLLDDPKRLPWLDEIRPEFQRKVKHQGLLSFQLIRMATPDTREPGSLADWNKNPLALDQVGQSIPASSLERSSIYTLQNWHGKPLREHGITVLFSGFSELKPQQEIRLRMADRWTAKLDLDIKTTRAKHEREAMQLINSARTQAQRDATYFLSNLLKKENHSKEALALLLFQALQAAATDEKNHKDLPPREILSMMQNLHRWLLVEWAESDAKRKKDGKQPPAPAEQPRT